MSCYAFCMFCSLLLLQHVLDMGDDANEQGTATDVGPSVAHTYDDVNISEEVKKTGIWHHLNSQPTLAAAISSDVSHPRHRFALSCFSCYAVIRNTCTLFEAPVFCF